MLTVFKRHDSKHLGSGKSENRRSIVGSERLQTLKVGNILDSNICALDEFIGGYCKPRHLRAGFFCVGLYHAVELGDILALDCKSARALMSAEFYEDIPTGLKALEYIKALHAPCRADCKAVIILRNNHHRLFISFKQSRSNYAYYAVMPAIAVNH